MQESNNIVILITTVSSAILMLLLIITLILLNFQKKRMVNDKLIEFYKTNFQKNLLRSRIEIQEDTLNKISQEVHDNIGLTLTLAKLKMSTLNKMKNPEVLDTTIQTVELISRALDDLRSLSHNMNPEVVKSVGLLTAIKEELYRINKTKLVNIKLEASGNPFYLESKTELLIFRIIQELLSNIIKHSFAKNTWISILYKEDNWIYLTVKDNGVGMDTESQHYNIIKSSSSGLINLQSRCSLLNGTLEIISNPSGTTISLAIPPQQQSNE